MLALATWRWQILLRALGRPAPRSRQLTASYLVATFFNNFLPSNIGGDIVRVRDSSQLTGSTATSLAVVGIDRILGFGALYLLAAVAFVAGAPRRARPRRRAGRCSSASRLLFGFLAYVFFRPGHRPLAHGRLAPELDRLGPRAVRGRAGRGARLPRADRDDLAGRRSRASSSRPSSSSTTWRSPAALGIPLPASAAFLMVPLCTLLQAVPVSFNGWGLREGLFALYFAQVGLPRASALAFSLVGAGLMVLLSLSGAVVWMARGSGVPAEPTAA